MTDKVKDFVLNHRNRRLKDLPMILADAKYEKENGRPKFTKEELDEIHEELLNGLVMVDTEAGGKIPASKMYRYSKDFLSKPVAICSNTQLGLPTCEKGEGKYCYYRLACEAQVTEDGEPATVNGRRQRDVMVRDCRERYKESLENYEREMNAFDYDKMIRDILGG